MTELQIKQKVVAADLLTILTNNYFTLRFQAGDVYIFDAENFVAKKLCYEPKVEAMAKKLEAEHGYMVYAVTHEITSFGECYLFLVVSKYPEDWDMLVSSGRDRSGLYKHYAQAYVWNVDHEECSESGGIVVMFNGGFLQRVG